MDLATLENLIETRRFPIHWPGQWIHNRWHAVRPTANNKSSANPSNGLKLMDVWIDRDSTTAAIAGALAVKGELLALSLPERMQLLRRFRQVLADCSRLVVQLLRIEAGKPAWEAQDDLTAAIAYLDWICNHERSINDALLAPARLGPNRGGEFAMLPIGPAAAYLPFSTPLTSFVFYFGATMLAGCPLILTSSAHASVLALLLATIGAKAELPASTLNIVFGNFTCFRQLVAHKAIAAILYTGSREHCEVIRAESRAQVGRQVVLQSGGKNAVLVDTSADLSLAVRCVVYGALKSAGQRCSSTSRVFVHNSRLAEFLDALAAAFQGVKIGPTDVGEIGDPAAQVFMGPLYSDKALQKYLRFQTMANREAKKTVLWGRGLEGQSGHFATPSIHLMESFDNASAYQGNVLFSPNVAVYGFDRLTDALEQLNTTDAAYAVSYVGDPEVIGKLRGQILVPNILVNAPTVEVEATLPLGGRLASGHHRFHGPGTALYLCYSQVLSQDPVAEERLRTWPWPSF